MTRKLTAFALIVLFFSTPAWGADKRPMTPFDLWAMKRLGAPALSPDGRAAVFTVQEWSVDKNKSTTNLWLVELSGGEPRRLTTAQATDSAPAWSPDGRRIAFVSKRGDDEASALYVIPIDGGEAEEIIEMPYALTTPKWLPDGKQIVVGTTVIPELAGTLSKKDIAAMKKESKRRKDSKMTARATENRLYRYFDHYLTDKLASRLLRVDVTTKEAVDLTPGFDRLFSVDGELRYEVSPDGSQVAVVINSTPPPFRDDPNSDIYLVATNGSGQLKNLTADNKGGDGSPTFAHDGRSLVYARRESSYYNGEFARLRRLDLASGKSTALTAELDYSFDEVKFSPDGQTLWLVAEDKGVVPVFKMNADGTGFAAVYREGASANLQSGKTALVFLNTDSNRPDELFTIDPATGKARQLTRFNEKLLSQLDLGKVEEFWFDGAAGDKIQGWLIYPPSYDASKTYPFMHVMHGGPHTMSRSAFTYRWNHHAFAAPGYIVACVNRHGSTGFGEKFSQSILNEWPDKPFDDIMKGTDFLLAKLPNIDPKRMAATGASYGGYMAAWVLGHTDRFAAIIDHAGVNNSYSQFATDVPHGFEKVIGGTPWKNVEGMQRYNPMYYAKNFKSPTLITHGELDYRVPYGNGLELYGVLQAMNVPSRLVVFPNENHWVLSPQNSIYWYYEFQSWLARYLGMPSPKKPTFEVETE
ncbi:MAG TPA: S9 family peptidase [Pirellulales bacterium]|nr:S9 family peptidase [Pirellulales bacterium]